MYTTAAGTGLDTAQPDGRAVLPWQSGDMMITYGLEGAATLTLRASGGCMQLGSLGAAGSGACGTRSGPLGC